MNLTIEDIKHPSWGVLANYLIDLPKKFWINFRIHVLVLLPLIVTQLLQRLQDLVDDRFMAMLGKSVLTIHNVQYNFFILANEIGLVAATSALIFWKRKETHGKQGSILKRHLALATVLSVGTSIVLGYFIPNIMSHFNVDPHYSYQADLYLKLGLVNLVLRALYVPVNAILIASDQKFKSMIYAGGIMLAKLVVGLASVQIIWNKNVNPSALTLPMILISSGSVVIFSVALIYGIRDIAKFVNGWENFSWKSLFKVWPGELGIAAVSALAPIIFSFQLAKANASSGFFVTYQLALHLTYILSLPVLAGMQIAVRDASEEQSESAIGIQYKPLHESRWWPHFFYASFMPTLLLFGVTVFLARPIFKVIYAYEIPSDHLIFIPIFYVAWMLWQWGSIYLVMLRASQKNGLATRNFIIAGVGVQVGITQVLLHFGKATPLALGLVILAYCSTYLILNRRAIFEIQSKYYLLKAREKIKFPKIRIKPILEKIHVSSTHKISS